MSELLDYADEIVRLAMNDGYRVNEAIKMVKEKAIKGTGK